MKKKKSAEKIEHTEPRRLKSYNMRRMARCTRDAQWAFMERAAKLHPKPLWFCVWNKAKLPEKADEMRCCLLSGMDILEWTRAHKEWFIVGRWSERRYAVPVRLTEAGLLALDEREKYDMEPVHGGLVEPGYIVQPLPPFKSHGPHRWEAVPNDLDHLFSSWRRCARCGKEQERVASRSWGRVTGYDWWPLAGRCAGENHA